MSILVPDMLMNTLIRLVSSLVASKCPTRFSFTIIYTRIQSIPWLNQEHIFGCINIDVNILSIYCNVKLLLLLFLFKRIVSRIGLSGALLGRCWSNFTCSAREIYLNLREIHSRTSRSRNWLVVKMDRCPPTVFNIPPSAENVDMGLFLQFWEKPESKCSPT